MRAREFITEQQDLPPEIKDPLRDTYVLPGLSASDPYKSYRLGVAMARARSDAGADKIPYMPKWSADTVFGEHAVVSGFNHSVGAVIDQALAMTNTPGGKKLVSTEPSTEPNLVNHTSPVKSFAGYPR